MGAIEEKPVVVVYRSRVLGAEGFGMVGAALAFVTYFAIVVNAGLDPCATREVARRPREVQELLSGIVRFRARGRPDLALLFGGGLFAAALDSA